jgi:hypothetical protein
MAERQIQDLLALDRDVARAAKALARWRALLAANPDEAADDDPFEGLRDVAAKSTWDRLGELPVSAGDEPLRAGLRRWVLAFVQARLAGVDDLAWAGDAATPRGRFEGDRPRAVSWREAWRGVVVARTSAEASLWLEAAAGSAPSLAPLGRRRASRRVEVARRMGFADPWEPEVPIAIGTLRASASRFLERTDDLSLAVWRESLGAEPGAAAVLHAAVAREAGEGWPARLTPRWLEELFGAGTRGLTLDLPTLPQTIGAASFARGLALFGHAFRVASNQGSMPFALARDPWFVGAHRLAFVFGALAADPQFYLRALGLGQRVAGGQARVLARTALLEARVAAARLLLGGDEPGRRDAFDDIAARLFGAPMGRRFHGVWPAAREDEPARWLALLLTPELRASLRDHFDTDWFRNPRAWVHLRSLGAGPAFETVDEGALESGGDALVRSFEHALG